MSSVPVATCGRDGWTLPLFFARVAWADEPFDSLTDVLSGLAPAHLLTVVGDPVTGLEGLDPAAGPAVVLPGVVRALRGARDPGPAVLSLVTATAGDIGSIPAVGGLRSDIGWDGFAVVVRDDRVGSAVSLSPTLVSPDVMRWTVRGIEWCPESPSTSGIAESGSRLSSAVLNAAELVDHATSRSGGPGVVERPDVTPRMSPLPRGLPNRVLDLVDRIDAVEAISNVALVNRGQGNAVAEREPVLRSLRSALDQARRAVVTAVSAEVIKEGSH